MSFTKPNDNKLMQFEKEIAYFYGAKNPEHIARHYLEAIKELETLGIHSKKGALSQAMIPPLKQAYTEVQKQTSLIFDLDVVAQLELDLILAQAQEEPFEYIYQIMLKLYAAVFKEPEHNFHKSAMLRTFLYKYKVSLLKLKKPLEEEDFNVLLSVAKASEIELKTASKPYKKEDL